MRGKTSLMLHQLIQSIRDGMPRAIVICHDHHYCSILLSRVHSMLKDIYPRDQLLVHSNPLLTTVAESTIYFSIPQEAIHLPYAQSGIFIDHYLLDSGKDKTDPNLKQLIEFIKGTK